MWGLWATAVSRHCWRKLKSGTGKVTLNTKHVPAWRGPRSARELNRPTSAERCSRRALAVGPSVAKMAALKSQTSVCVYVCVCAVILVCYAMLEWTHWPSLTTTPRRTLDRIFFFLSLSQHVAEDEIFHHINQTKKTKIAVSLILRFWFCRKNVIKHNSLWRKLSLSLYLSLCHTLHSQPRVCLVRLFLRHINFRTKHQKSTLAEIYKSDQSITSEHCHLGC